MLHSSDKRGECRSGANPLPPAVQNTEFREHRRKPCHDCPGSRRRDEVGWAVSLALYALARVRWIRNERTHPNKASSQTPNKGRQSKL